jgi:hypothetical protein
MTLRIEKCSEGARTIFKVSGRIGAQNLEELKRELRGQNGHTSIDLEHVTLVDVDGVRFLGDCVTDGMELLHCSPYISEWIDRERNR